MMYLTLTSPKKQTQFQTSDICLLFSVFCFLSSVFCRPFSVVRFLSSVLEFTQEFIPGSHPPDSQQGSAGFSASLPGVFCFLMQPKLLNFHRKNSLTVWLNSLKYRFLCNERECFYEKLYGKERKRRA